MSPAAEAAPSASSDAVLAAALFAIDPSGMGGVAVRARPGPLRDDWLKQLGDLFPAGTPMRRLPLHASHNRLLGGLDLAATLRAGRPVVERGVLAQASGGVLVLAMAERIPAATVACLSTVLDSGEVVLERDGLADRFPTRVGMIALDEGIDDEQPHPALLDRLAFHIDLHGLDAIVPAVDRDAIDRARSLLPSLAGEDAILTVLSDTALMLGVASLRAEIFALRVAKASAALAGRTDLTGDDAAVAARLVLAPRATRFPALEPAAPADPQPSGASDPAPGGAHPSDGGEESGAPSERDLGEIVLQSVRAGLAPGLLERLQAGQSRSASALPGHAGASQLSTKRGRPAGVRRGELRGGARINIIETLRAAAPWQRLRAPATCAPAPGEKTALVKIRPEDVRITRFHQKSETTTIFVVDASGSLALNRLAEAKGAVELLLADCYLRRDQVALLAFRGARAELLLPPTRSLVRAKRSLAGLPGGGATPLATAIDAAVALGSQLRRRGQTPVIVFLTDGRANVARDGTAERSRAERDVLAAARAARETGIKSLVVDAAQRPQPAARSLAKELNAIYVALPHADATALSAAVRAAAP